MSFFGKKTSKPSPHEQAWYHMRGGIWEYWRSTGSNRQAYERTVAATEKALFDLKQILEHKEKGGTNT